jgi:alpha-1,3-glucosyltransferase
MTKVCSMWPLLRKDGLTAQYIALTLLWNRLIGHGPFIAPSQATFLDIFTWVWPFDISFTSRLSQPPRDQVVYLGCALLHLLEFAYRPPARYPDLFPVLNVLISTPIFLFAWLWSIKSIIEARWTVGGLSVGEPKEKKSDLGMRFPSESLGPSGVSSAIAPVEGVRNRREGGLRTQSLGYTKGRGRLD